MQRIIYLGGKPDSDRTGSAQNKACFGFFFLSDVRFKQT